MRAKTVSRTLGESKIFAVEQKFNYSRTELAENTVRANNLSMQTVAQ
jgi:hypothetical protein